MTSAEAGPQRIVRRSPASTATRGGGLPEGAPFAVPGPQTQAPVFADERDETLVQRVKGFRQDDVRAIDCRADGETAVAGERMADAIQDGVRRREARLVRRDFWSGPPKQSSSSGGCRRAARNVQPAHRRDRRAL